MSAFKGASADLLSQERGDFFKGRSGFDIALLYLSTIFTTVLIPYTVVLMYHWNSQYRHFCFLIAFVFCISFLQKALFLNIFLPLLAYFALQGQIKFGKMLFVFLAVSSILILFVYLSNTGESSEMTVDTQSAADFFSGQYSYGSSLGYFLWRAIAVPVFTASDTLIVHAEVFNGDLIYGATSSLIAALFGVERINIERFVFEYQFGGWNDTANANAVYVTDAFVNFGYLGVVGFSLLVGQIFRWFHLSKDVAFRCLWPVFALTLYSASLIGMLLSNGFAYILIHALFLNLKNKNNLVHQ